MQLCKPRFRYKSQSTKPSPLPLVDKDNQCDESKDDNDSSEGKQSGVGVLYPPDVRLEWSRSHWSQCGIIQTLSLQLRSNAKDVLRLEVHSNSFHRCELVDPLAEVAYQGL
ncbi:hypothetical protein DPMN_036499 [Dreissena polymorpha]|uniref:Uncharacterized protein n=1 Tax=Dreissena polymorpha TaxID=45954 RepID=A0A9D4RN54_DREPO|nr:hypothetical protein DPMN_036499 [Dreissena polymorpha]